MTIVARIPSRTQPGVVYTVERDTATNALHCDCRGFAYQGRCWHVDEDERAIRAFLNAKDEDAEIIAILEGAR